MSSSTKRLHIYGSVVQSGNLAAPTTAIYIRTCVYVCVSLRVVFQHRNSCTRGGGTGGRASFDPTKTRSFLSSRVRKKYECSNKIFEKYVRSVRRQTVYKTVRYIQRIKFFYLVTVTEKKKDKKKKKGERYRDMYNHVYIYI